MKKNLLTLLTLISLFLTTSNLMAGETVAEGSLEGAFSSWGKSSLSGNWKIVETDGKHFIELSDDFQAKKGPDVKIFLSPLEASTIDGNNAAEGSVFIKLISNFKGKSRIEIPEGIDVSQFNSLVFHCEEYSKLWGVSPL